MPYDDIDDKVILDRIDSRSNIIYISSILFMFVFLFSDKTTEFAIGGAKLTVPSKFLLRALVLLADFSAATIFLFHQFLGASQKLRYAETQLCDLQGDARSAAGGSTTTQVKHASIAEEIQRSASERLIKQKFWLRFILVWLPLFVAGLCTLIEVLKVD